MILCRICNKSFDHVITWKHLKTHNLTTSEYKLQYGEKSLASDEFRSLRSAAASGENNPNFGNYWCEEQREALSSKNKGKTAHNKGQPISEEQKKLISEKAIERHKQWHHTSSHPIVGTKRNQDTIDKIREKRNKQKIQPEAIQKAIKSKLDKGYDLAFFRGKKHTDESIEKIRKSSLRNGKKKSDQAIEQAKSNLKEINISITSIKEQYYELICNICNSNFTFTRQYTRGQKFKKTLCPCCYPRDQGYSKSEKEIYDWIKSLGVTIIPNDRSIISPMELDIVIPDKSLAIEYCGLYWHSELNGKGKNYHLDKMKQCANIGIQLITIFEDEWKATPEIVKSRISNVLGLIDRSIYARKCNIKEIDTNVAKEFLTENHIQGAGRSNIKYGAFYNDELVAVMTFSKGNISRKSATWEIDRFCSKINTSIIGIASKLFKQFLKNIDPDEVITYADRRWSKFGFYESLGFVFDSETPPNYWYFNETLPIKRVHRFSLRKNKFDDPTLSEWENRQNQGWDRIWDCGSNKFVYKKSPI